MKASLLLGLSVRTQPEDVQALSFDERGPLYHGQVIRPARGSLAASTPGVNDE
jgi:hypothetical protein